MDWLTWLSLVGICLLGAMSPGPSLAVVTRATLQGGLGHGLASAIAHGVGVGLYGLITVAGLAALIAGSPRLFLLIQVLGALYLIYLGIKSLRSSGAPPVADDESSSDSSHGAAVSGFLVAFLNPKLAVFMLALFSQFLRPGFGAVELTAMVATAGAIDGLWYSIVALLLTRPRALAKLQQHGLLLDRVFGALLLALAVYILASVLLTL